MCLFSQNVANLSKNIPWLPTRTCEVMKRAAQQWISTTRAYTFCRKASFPCVPSPSGPSVQSVSPSFFRSPSPTFSILVGSSSQTGSSSGFRKMESSVCDRVELLSRRVMVLVSEVPLRQVTALADVPPLGRHVAPDSRRLKQRDVKV